jgi:NTP pyrophosphatase (non-canonical NTP hydrolase)
MDLADYQRRARHTSRLGDSEQAVVVGLLGLAGETGTLLTEYKKRLRDGPAHHGHRNAMAEELGDVLWYVAEIASCCGIDLNEAAMQNLAKVADRWGSSDGDEELPLAIRTGFYDEAYPRAEQLPRSFRIRIVEDRRSSPPRITLYRGHARVGDTLTDNAYDDDGYRFHDIFHMGYAAVLGWSPVFRKLLDCKRRSDPLTDRVEDGGRAAVVEEGIAAFIYGYAKKHDYLRDIKHLDTEVLRTIRNMTEGLEVSSRTAHDWERAILDGFSVWRQVWEHNGGTVVADLRRRSIRFEKPGALSKRTGRRLR